MNENVKIIGLGNKARHGKDTLASILKDKLEGAVVVHFADPLKEEVSQKLEQPLIFKRHSNGKNFYYLRDHINTYVMQTAEQMPYLHSIFEKRCINEYWYMDEKDSEILQVWGTNFRRQQDPSYWVNKIERIILNLQATDVAMKYVLLPDARFINEYDFIKSNNGIYIKVVRISDDGELFIDPQRSPNHPSETELDHVDADLKFEAKSGDLKALEKAADEVLTYLDYNKKGS